MAKTVVKRKEKKNITSGVAHVNSTFNNTRVTITLRETQFPGRQPVLRALKAPESLRLMLRRLLRKKPVRKLRKTV